MRSGRRPSAIVLQNPKGDPRRKWRSNRSTQTARSVLCSRGQHPPFHSVSQCQRAAATSCRILSRLVLLVLLAAGCLSADNWIVAAEPARNDKPIVKTSELGPVRLTAQLDPPQPLVGDPVTFTLSVTAEKGVELLLPEFGESLERFAILDYVPRQAVDDQGRTIASQKYRLQPPSSGKQAIPPILVEFVDRRPGRRRRRKGKMPTSCSASGSSSRFSPCCRRTFRPTSSRRWGGSVRCKSPLRRVGHG